MGQSTHKSDPTSDIVSHWRDRQAPQRPTLKRRRSESDHLCSPPPKAPVLGSASNRTSEHEPTESPKFLRAFAPRLAITKVRELIEHVVHYTIYTSRKCLVSRDTCHEYGEELNVEMKNNNGQTTTNTLEWLVEPNVPACILSKSSTHSLYRSHDRS